MVARIEILRVRRIARKRSRFLHFDAQRILSDASTSDVEVYEAEGR